MMNIRSMVAGAPVRLVTSVLVIAWGSASAQTIAVTFDGLQEGVMTETYVENGVTFFDFDPRYAIIAPYFSAEEATDVLSEFPDFTSPMVLGFNGFSPGGNVSFCRCGSVKIAPPEVFEEVSMHLYVISNAWVEGNKVTLQAWRNGAIVDTDHFLNPVEWGPHHFELAISGTPFDELRVVGTGPLQKGCFLAVLDTVFLGPVPTVGTYCVGDPGVGTPCPCGNDNDGSVPGSGCANGVFSSGARLVGSGLASVGADTLALAASGLEPGNVALYFQGDTSINGRDGLPFGEGLRCVGGSPVKLQVRIASASGNASTDVAIASTGNVSAGDRKYYQCCYRTSASPACGGGAAGFNFTNGCAVTWVP